MAKRCIAIVSAVLAIYVSIGSWLYGDWYFGLFWRGKLWDINYILDGFGYLVDKAFYGVLIVLGLCVVVLVLVRIYKHKLLPVIDRFVGWITLFSWITILTTVLLVYHFNQQSYAQLEKIEAIAEDMKKTISQLESIGQPPPFQTPVDFQYLDEPRIEALYSQLEPELVEKERIVADENKVHGEAKVGVADSSVGAEAGIEKSSRSSFQRSSFLPARKCTEVMKFERESQRAKYYSTGGRWYLSKIGDFVREKVKEAESNPEPIDKKKLESLRGIRPATKEEQDEINATLARDNQDFEQEMGSLTGLVFVEGEYSIHREPSGKLVLLEEFAQKPKHIWFQCRFPATSKLDQMFPQKRVHLTIFGSVVRPLGSDGIIEISPIAAYE